MALACGVEVEAHEVIEKHKRNLKSFLSQQTFTTGTGSSSTGRQKYSLTHILSMLAIYFNGQHYIMAVMMLCYRKMMYVPKISKYLWKKAVMIP